MPFFHSCHHVSTSKVKSSNHLCRRNRLLHHSLLEILKTSFGLIVRHFVASGVDLEPREVADGLVETSLLAVNGVLGQGLVLERRGLRPWDGVGDVEAADVVADVV